LRAGVRLITAVQWLGITPTRWKKWRERQGEPYLSMRRAIAQARAHVEVKLQSELAKKSPGAALKALQRQITDDDAEPDEPTRTYTRSGMHSMRRHLPNVLSRIQDESISRDDLHPVEAAAKDWRDAVIADLGGREACTQTQLALVQAATGSWLILATVDSHIFALAADKGLVDRRAHKVHDVILQRQAIADSLTRQLDKLGLQKRKLEPIALDQYVQQKYGSTNGTN
jgi:hypothetical protein